MRLTRFIPKIQFYQKYEECIGKAKIRGRETEGEPFKESWCLKLSELKQQKQREIKDFEKYLGVKLR